MLPRLLDLYGFVRNDLHDWRKLQKDVDRVNIILVRNRSGLKQVVHFVTFCCLASCSVLVLELFVLLVVLLLRAVPLFLPFTCAGHHGHRPGIPSAVLGQGMLYIILSGFPHPFVCAGHCGHKPGSPSAVLGQGILCEDLSGLISPLCTCRASWTRTRQPYCSA